MALQAGVQGARNTAQRITWSDADGNAKNLTDATLSGIIRDQHGNTRAVDGSLELVTAASGIFDWTYGANDVATAGHFTVQFKADYGSQYDLSFPQAWEVQGAI